MDKVLLDNFEWAQHLGCPLVANFQEREKTMLNCGIVSFAWEEISSRSLPVYCALEARKNILLYHVRNKIKIKSIDHINNIKRLKIERNKIKERFEQIENERKKIYESIESKRATIAKVKSLTQSTKVKKKILQSKHEEIQRDMNGCNELLLEFKNLQPSSSNKIDENFMLKTVALVGNISCRQEKKEAWQRICENLEEISIPILWKWLLNKRIQDTNKVVHLGVQLAEKTEITNDVIKNEEEKEKKIQIYHNKELAKVYGKHILNSINILKYALGADEYQSNTVEYIEKIFMSGQRENITEWFELNLQIPQLEKRRMILKHHINELDTIKNDEENLRTRYNELCCLLEKTEEKMNECIQKFQKSLTRLKSSGQFLFQIKNHSTISLNSITTLLHSENNPEWLNLSINTEMNEFYKNLDVNALDKVMLVNIKNPYRHAIKCMSNAFLTIPSTSIFVPVYHVPIYNIINCLKNLSINILLKQQKNKSNVIEKSAIVASKNIVSIKLENKNTNILELLNNVSCLSEICYTELEQLNALYNFWAHQPVQSVIEIMENVVFKATFSEWIKRYTTLIYMIQRNK